MAFCLFASVVVVVVVGFLSVFDEGLIEKRFKTWTAEPGMKPGIVSRSAHCNH